ncbi:hypothetical protein ACCD10_32670, partial [Pseudomonas sp. Pseusp122]|uniref:hypothetical protein n=2 Tax=unclassified Pseudomonas TaxID=196821 RepID=UPI0039B0B52C
MSTPVESQSYYAPEAYHPDRIPEQPDALPRKLLFKLIGTRLPWGNTQEVLPDNIMQDPSPEKMRYGEKFEKEKAEQKANGTYVTRPFEHLELHYRHDHEVIRHAQFPFKTQFWLFLKGGGKWLTIILILPLFLTHLTMIPLVGGADNSLTYYDLLEVYAWFLGIPFACGLIGHMVVEYFPKVWLRAPKGPLWELNRRTGLVTIFDYKDFKKTGKIGEFTASFYEFDAYIITNPDRQGLPMIGLSLAHRYSNKGMNFNDMIAPDNLAQTPCALWDFFQNFMDISRPLPDVPVHEAHRHLDPVTAEYDRQTGRDPRYWIDMDN